MADAVIHEVGDAAEARQLWRVRKTIFHMCHDRGYFVTQEELDEPLEKFVEEFFNPSRPFDRKNIDLILVQTGSDDQMFVHFVKDKGCINTVRQMYSNMQKENIFRAIIVTEKGLSPFGKECLSDMSPKYKLEHFLESELLFNITEHNMVPMHVALTPDEKNELLTRYKLKASQLMRIQVGDPVARYYGLERGQVVKIVRISETAGRYISYRLVC